jgi:DNA-binding winged helix-turn-helix (wHTH) protein
VASYDDGRLYVDFDKLRVTLEGKTVDLRSTEIETIRGVGYRYRSPSV